MLDIIVSFCLEHGLSWRYEYYYHFNQMHLVFTNPKTDKHWGMLISPEELAKLMPVTKPRQCALSAQLIIDRIPKDLYM